MFLNSSILEVKSRAGAASLLNGPEERGRPVVSCGLATWVGRPTLHTYTSLSVASSPSSGRKCSIASSSSSFHIIQRPPLTAVTHQFLSRAALIDIEHWSNDR